MNDELDTLRSFRPEATGPTDALILEGRNALMTAIENPATSTPGLAFMLATIAKFGEDGWQDYWRRLRANGVLAVDGWEEAYTARFSGAGGSKGKRPIVVSYATSPAAEVIFAKTPPKTAPTAVVDGQLLPPDRARGRARRREEREGRAGVHRLHALGAVPGSDAGEHVRAARARRHAAARGVSRSTPSRRRTRSSCLRPRSAATAIAGSTSGHRSSCAETRRAARHDRRPGGVPRALLRISTRRHPRARPDVRGWAFAAGGHGRSRLVHGLAGGSVDGAHARRRAPARVGDRPVPVSWPRARPRARARAVRAADGRRRDRLSGRAARRLRARPLGHPRRARLLQRRGRDAHRRRRLGGDRPPERRSRSGARSRAAAPRPRGDPAPVGPRDLRSLGADVPVLLHVVRRDPDSRWPRPSDGGDGDLQPGRAALRPAGGGRAVAAAARRRCDRAHGGRDPGGTGGWRRHARRRERRAPPAARMGAPCRRRRARGRSARAPLPARRSRRAIAGQLGRALRDDACAPGRAVGGGRVLRRVRKRCRGDRPRRRWTRGHRAGAAARRRRRRLRAAPPRRLGRDARLRVPDRVRRGTTRLPVVVVARPRRPVAHRGAVRRPDRHARTPVDRPGVARGGRDARRIPLRSRREIDMPLVGRAFAVAAGFAFAIALGEFGATVFVARAEQPTLPVAIFRFLGRPGEANQGVAAALAVVLAAIAAGAALLAERAADGRGRAL